MSTIARPPLAGDASEWRIFAREQRPAIERGASQLRVFAESVAGAAFYFGGDQFSGARRRNCGDPGAERQRQIYFAEIDCGFAGASFRTRAAEWI